jgi:hypothetical protein
MKQYHNAKIKTIKLVGHVERMGEMSNEYMNFVTNSKGKRLFGTPSCSLNGNIKARLKEMESRDVDWIMWLRVGTSDGLL